MFTTSKYALCSFKNSATHVNRLPIEILVRIFSCVMAARPHFGRFPYYLSQTTFGAVCKHWRRITLSSPLLWDFITSCSHPSMIEIAIQRSQNITLKAYIERCEPGFVDLVQPHISSIKYLTCDFTRGVVTADQPHALVVISPILERLNLRRCHITDTGRMLSVSGTPFSRTAVRVMLPGSLNYLSLFFTPLTDHFTHLTTLTNVSLQGIEAPFETILLLLKNNIRLEEIRVADILLEDANRSGETVSLPHLRKFSYSGDTTYPFLHRLTTPQRAQFSFKFIDTLKDSATILQDVLPVSLAPHRMPPIDFLSFQINHPSATISTRNSEGGGISISWQDERLSNEAVSWDLLDLQTAREVCLSLSPTAHHGPAHLHDIGALLERARCFDTLSLSNPGEMYESSVLSTITPGSTKGLWPSLSKIRIAGPAQGFPLRELVDLVKTRKETDGISDIRHVDVLILRGGSVPLDELERLVSVNVKVVDAWMVPGGWERGGVANC